MPSRQDEAKKKSSYFGVCLFCFFLDEKVNFILAYLQLVSFWSDKGNGN